MFGAGLVLAFFAISILIDARPELEDVAAGRPVAAHSLVSGWADYCRDVKALPFGGAGFAALEGGICVTCQGE